jgi:hypothetical protein
MAAKVLVIKKRAPRWGWLVKVVGVWVGEAKEVEVDVRREGGERGVRA